MDSRRLAVIGYGHMAQRVYGPLLHTLADRVRLGGVVEPDPARRAAAVATYAFGSSHATVDELLAESPPRAALVLVPATHHEPVLRALLGAGVDVYTEKPDVPSLSTARELVELARQRELVYQVGQNRLFMTALKEVREFFGETPVDFMLAEKSKTVRRSDPEYLFDDGIHVLSPLIHLAGGVAEVLSALHLPQRLLSAHFRLANGGAGALLMHLDDGYWVERFQLHGEGRSANVITPDTVELYEQGRLVGNGRVPRMTQLFNPAELWGFQAAVSHFLDCVESRIEPRGSAASLLRVHEVMNEVFTLAGLPTL